MASRTNPRPRNSKTECRVARRRWDAPAALGFWHLASLDAPTVALVWSWAFARAAHVRIPGWAPIALALIVWAVYIADRLLDARAGMQSPPLHFLRDRHYFHWRYRWLLAPLGLVAALTAADIVATRLPAGARVPDSALAAATLAYFSGVHSRRGIWPLIERLLAPVSAKALLIGILFTAGCLLPLASQVPQSAAPATARVLAGPALFLGAAAWLNCYAICQWESGSSLQHGILRRACVITSVAGVAGLLMVSTDAGAALLVVSGAVAAILIAVLDWFRPASRHSRFVPPQTWRCLRRLCCSGSGPRANEHAPGSSG